MNKVVMSPVNSVHVEKSKITTKKKNKNMKTQNADTGYFLSKQTLYCEFPYCSVFQYFSFHICIRIKE